MPDRHPLIALSLALLLSLIMLAACSAPTNSLDQATPAVVNSVAPGTAAAEQMAPDLGISATETPGVTGGFDCAVVNQVPQAECAALVALYNSTNGPDWTDDTGWLVTDTPCAWPGVTCTNGNVSHISLVYNRLTGTLPPELGDLSHVRVVELWNNQLRGPIPAGVGDLSELVSLGLAGNQLSGPLPAEVGKLHKLQSLSLAYNQIGGSIPATLGNLKGLGSLDLSHNQLGGSIPEEVGDMDNLVALRLSHNRLSGPIPAALGNLAKLDELDVSYNRLSGPVPEFVAHINQRMLWGNRLEGTVTGNGQVPFMVDYMGIHFQADPSLASSIWPEMVPASPLPEVPDGPGYWLAIPEHSRFTFAGPSLSPLRRPMGFNLASEAQILIFPLAELAGMNESVQAQIETLRNLLTGRGPVPDGELPLLPLTNSAQVFHAQARYLDFGDIQGLRFISQHSQDPHPFLLSQELFYTFQGFTGDGAYYVAAFFPLATAALPGTIEVEDWEVFHANYDSYLSEKTAVLDQLPQTGFTPALTLIDAAVTSLRIDRP